MNTRLNINAIENGSITVDKLNEDVFLGNYPDMTVGSAVKADSLGDRPFVEEDANFSFRATAGSTNSIKDGIAEITELRGNAVVWNQLMDINNTWGNNADLSIDNRKITAFLKSTATEHRYGGPAFGVDNTPWVIGHKYLFLIDDVEYHKNINLITIGNAFGGEGNDNAILKNGILRKEIFLHATLDSSSTCCYINAVGDLSEGDWFSLDNFRSHDLTKMFGAGNEPTTIEEFNTRKPIIADEYAYNKGEVILFTADGIKSVGDNAWDGEWEQGDVSGSNGVEMDSTATWRNKGYIRIIPNEYYYIQSDSRSFLRARFYDADKNFIGIVSANNTDIYTNEAFKTASNAHYMRFAPNKSAIAEGTMMCVSLVHSGYKEGQYFPYESDTLKFDSRIKEAFPDGMTHCDKVYNKNGKGYTVKVVDNVDLGNFDYSFSQGVFITYIGNMKGIDNQDVAIMAQYNQSPSVYGENFYNNVEDKVYKTNGSAVGGLNSLAISDSSYTDATSFKAAMSGVLLYYELAEPIVTEYDEPFNLSYRAWDFGTEEVVNRIDDIRAIIPTTPINATIQYNINEEDTIRDNKLNIGKLKNYADKINKKTINDWDAQIDEDGYIANKTHYWQQYTPKEYLTATDSTIGTTISPIGDYFKLGDYIYSSESIVDKEFNCQTAGAPVIVKVIKQHIYNEYEEYDEYYLYHVSGNTDSGAPIEFSGAGYVKHLDDVYLSNNIARSFGIVEFEAQSTNEILPNTYYKVNIGISSAAFTLGTTANNISNEYIMELDCQVDCMVAFPSSIKWANDNIPSFVAGKKYVISIVDDLAVFAEF